MVCMLLEVDCMLNACPACFPPQTHPNFPPQTPPNVPLQTPPNFHRGQFDARVGHFELD